MLQFDMRKDGTNNMMDRGDRTVTHVLCLVGTGDSLGVPRVYCECPICSEARLHGMNQRTRCCAVLETEHGVVWLDCGPDWRAQMEWVRRRQASTVLITHAHHDHIGGIPDLADMARWTKQHVRVLGPQSVLDTIVSQYPWTERQLRFELLRSGSICRRIGCKFGRSIMGTTVGATVTGLSTRSTPGRTCLIA